MGDALAAGLGLFGDRWVLGGIGTASSIISATYLELSALGKGICFVQGDMALRTKQVDMLDEPVQEYVGSCAQRFGYIAHIL